MFRRAGEARFAFTVRVVGALGLNVLPRVAVTALGAIGVAEDGASSLHVVVNRAFGKTALALCLPLERLERDPGLAAHTGRCCAVVVVPSPFATLKPWIVALTRRLCRDVGALDAVARNTRRSAESRVVNGAGLALSTWACPCPRSVRSRGARVTRITGVVVGIRGPSQALQGRARELRPRADDGVARTALHTRGCCVLVVICGSFGAAFTGAIVLLGDLRARGAHEARRVRLTVVVRSFRYTQSRRICRWSPPG